MMRGVLLGGVVGALPGMLIAFEPLVSASPDVITSDQSQIGFALDIVGGIAVNSTLQSVGSTVGGTLLFVTPAAIIAGGVLGAWHGERTNPPQLPIVQA
jgi:hypothetical protein